MSENSLTHWDITFPSGATWLALKYNGLIFGFAKLDAQALSEF